MSGILMMLISTTRGDFAQPHGLETERYGNTAQMSATCNVLFLHTLKSSPILQQYAQCSQYTQYVQYAQYAQYTYYICHTERGGLHSVCSSCMFGCIVSSTYTIWLLLTDILVRAIMLVETVLQYILIISGQCVALSLFVWLGFTLLGIVGP